MESDALAARQLEALAEISTTLRRHGIEYWLFGGWAVDFHLGRITRPHADLDLAVWESDVPAIGSALATAGWSREAEPGEDGYLVFVRGEVRLELAFLAKDADGEIYTPAKSGRGEWPIRSFGLDERTLEGSRVRVVSLESLRTEKAADHGDATAAAKDQTDLEALEAL